MESVEFIKRGKELVSNRVGTETVAVFVVWYSKSLQNHQALFGAYNSDKYFELTYDGDKGVAYLDTYENEKNEDIDMLSGKPE